MQARQPGHQLRLKNTHPWSVWTSFGAVIHGGLAGYRSIAPLGHVQTDTLLLIRRCQAIYVRFAELLPKTCQSANHPNLAVRRVQPRCPLLGVKGAGSIRPRCCRSNGKLGYRKPPLRVLSPDVAISGSAPKRLHTATAPTARYLQ